MEESTAVRNALRQYWSLIERGDIDGCDALVTSGPIASVIGTAPGEEHPDRDVWVAAFKSQFETPAGHRVEPGNTRGYSNGDTGWAIDEPTWHLPDGSELPLRTTAVLAREDGDWKLIHLHVSIGVPDERVAEVLDMAATG